MNVKPGVPVVVADTSPINYLILTGHEELLFRLYGTIVVPKAVFDELRDEAAPAAVLKWTTNPPDWFVVMPADLSHGSGDLAGFPEGLDQGELCAILLAEAIHAELLLIDERLACQVARDRGHQTVGTLGW